MCIHRKICRYAQDRQIQEICLPVCAPDYDIDKFVCEEASIYIRGRGSGIQARNLTPGQPPSSSRRGKYSSFATRAYRCQGISVAINTERLQTEAHRSHDYCHVATRNLRATDVAFNPLRDLLVDTWSSRHVDHRDFNLYLSIYPSVNLQTNTNTHTDVHIDVSI